MKIAILVLCAASVALATPAHYIIGGETATDGQFPYQVALRIQDEFRCGGVILDESTILTSALCVENFAIEQLTVHAGSNNLLDQTVKSGVSKVTIHSEWDPVEIKIEHNLAILKLTEPFVLSEGSIEAVKISQVEMPDWQKVVLSGWGETSDPNGPIVNDLQFAELHTISVAVCKAHYLNQAQPIQIYNSQICTVAGIGKGACHHDSGSPLVNENKELVGILSWGVPCARGEPDVYTGTYSHLDWIEENRH